MRSINFNDQFEKGRTVKNGRRVLCAPSVSTVLQAGKPAASVISARLMRHYRPCETDPPYRYHRRQRVGMDPVPEVFADGAPDNKVVVKTGVEV
ncbi:hypothetical protein [Rhizobium chutanense]|uniref:hypothetical protein n=1 Tax=Rhizobium chutanense TaxID=2035448 RepID=UPI00117A930C|nr:hypothetical protein [Rhizobium chutanense]